MLKGRGDRRYAKPVGLVGSPLNTIDPNKGSLFLPGLTRRSFAAPLASFVPPQKGRLRFGFHTVTQPKTVVGIPSASTTLNAQIAVFCPKASPPPEFLPPVLGLDSPPRRPGAAV